MKQQQKAKIKQIDKTVIEGLQQNFPNKNSNLVPLYSVLTEKDYWQTKGKIIRTILTHDAIKKIADIAGVAKDPEYTVLTQPDAHNNYQYTIQIRICRNNECVTEIGEANRSNLGTKGRSNPANMAQKRAYDRAVLRLLGITGLLSEEELSDENKEENSMEKLSHDDAKKIAPIINKLLLATKKEHLVKFNTEMKKEAKTLQSNQLEYLRQLYKKKVAELSKTPF